MKREEILLRKPPLQRIFNVYNKTEALEVFQDISGTLHCAMLNRLVDQVFGDNFIGVSIQRNRES